MEINLSTESLIKNKCRLCDSLDVTLIDTEMYKFRKYTIFKCNNCTLVYVREIYDAVSPDFINMATLDDTHLWLQSVHKIDAFNQFFMLINKYLRPINNSVKLLDVGCGTGGFLNYISEKLAWQVFGFDSSLSQVNYAKKKFPIVNCTISINEYVKEIGMPDIKFDVFTLWDVLEHIREPVEFLKDLISHSNNGIIFISVPNALPMIIKNKFKFSKEFTWSPHEHVSYFSPRSLRFLCNMLDLQIIDIGCVKVYKRKFSIFEIIRRVFFFITSFLPNLAPQIYLVARSTSIK